MKQNLSHRSAVEAEVKLNPLYLTTKKNQSHHSNSDSNNSAHHHKSKIQPITNHFQLDTHQDSNKIQMEAEVAEPMHDMEEEEIKAEVREEDLIYPKNTPNTETKPKA